MPRIILLVEMPGPQNVVYSTSVRGPRTKQFGDA